MGSAPKKPRTVKLPEGFAAARTADAGVRKKTKVMSFEDARSARRTPGPAAEAIEKAQAAKKPKKSSLAGSRTSVSRSASKDKRKERPSLAAGGTRALKSSRQSQKEFNIQRGVVREGALYLPDLTEAEESERKAQEANKNRLARIAEDQKRGREKRKRARNKAKADKAFDKNYAGDKASGAMSAAGDAGPRAALYEGKMGSKQKKSQKMQSKGRDVLAATQATIPKVNAVRLPRKLRGFIGAVALLAIFGLALYGPAQQYYHQMRETDRLQAEYVAVSERTAALQSQIDALQSPEGIEDKAHSDLGYVKQGEQTATVKGITIEDTSEFSSNVIPNSIPAPVTWYSTVLDAFFDYGNN